jgi:DNA-binding LytR/AlgR family response regulator
MLRFAICDDEPAQQRLLNMIADSWAASRNTPARISAYDSAEALLFALADDGPFDILLLDVQMKELDGVSLARKLRETDDRAQIVFVTGYPDYIAEGYEVSALHYLIKPVNEDKLFEVLDRAAARLATDEITVLLPLKDGKQRIAVASIYYVEAFSHDLQIHTDQGEISVKMALNDIEKLLGNDFFRCHRSFLANMRHVRKVIKGSLEMENGDVLPLSRRLAAKAMEAFIETH